MLTLNLEFRVERSRISQRTATVFGINHVNLWGVQGYKMHYDEGLSRLCYLAPEARTRYPRSL